MTELSILISGAFLGMIGMAFLVLLYSVSRESREIQWHDATLENPKEYVVLNGTHSFIDVLVQLDTGAFVVTIYYVNSKSYGYKTAYAQVKHFAYIREVRRSIPQKIVLPKYR